MSRDLRQQLREAIKGLRRETFLYPESAANLAPGLAILSDMLMELEGSERDALKHLRLASIAQQMPEASPAELRSAVMARMGIARSTYYKHMKAAKPLLQSTKSTG